VVELRRPETGKVAMSTNQKNSRFYILTPYKIDAFDNHLPEFIADDLMYAIQAGQTKIATDEKILEQMEKEYPHYHMYEVTIGKLGNDK
jgi:hypothetical protein